MLPVSIPSAIPIARITRKITSGKRLPGGAAFCLSTVAMTTTSSIAVPKNSEKKQAALGT